MSSLGFLTRDQGEARVSGRETAKFSCLIRDLAWAAVVRSFDVHEVYGPSRLRQAVDLADWVIRSRGTEFARMAQLHVSASGAGGNVHLPGQRDTATILDVNLNTVLAGYADDAVALAVRLAAQCEVNAWIAGEDRAWLADLIDAGRTARYPPEVADSEYLSSHPLFADEPSVNGHYDGWKGVVDFLRAGDGTVVLDSSFTDGFPGIDHACWPAARPGKKFRRIWAGYGPDQQWDTSERGLRRRTGTMCRLLRISPSNLHDARYGFIQAPTWADVAAAWRATPRP